MAPPKKKKKKIPKHEKKKSLLQQGKKSAESRGIGAGSRKKFALAVHWMQESYKSSDCNSGTRKRVSCVSPGKTKYWSQKSVEKEMVSPNLTDCFYETSVSSTGGNTDGDSEYWPSSEEDTKW